MLGIPLALAYTNAGEWFIHKYVLHGMGKNRRSYWSFHWHDHHREARKHNMYDRQYTEPLLRWSPQSKEALSLAFSALTHLPLLPVMPFFTLTVWARTWNYYQKHKAMHLDPEWAKKNALWHYEHHLGKDQNANWCVTHPWFDYVMGTRKRWEYDENGKVLRELPVEKLRGWAWVKELWNQALAPS